MTLVREMPVNKVSKISGVDDNKLRRMMQYYLCEIRFWCKGNLVDIQVVKESDLHDVYF